MNKINIELPEIKLVGITTRTNNKETFSTDQNKITATIQKYFYNELFNSISHRKNPGTTFCVYTNYESDENGDYTYFIGEEVISFDEIEDNFEMLTIPMQKYVKFTNESGPMPGVCIDMWQKIWNMTPSILGGKRSYVADFEVYDQRSNDHQNVVLDLYIGINR